MLCGSESTPAQEAEREAQRDQRGIPCSGAPTPTGAPASCTLHHPLLVHRAEPAPGGQRSGFSGKGDRRKVKLKTTNGSLI